MFEIAPLSTSFSALITNKINNKTKPLGALGKLESLAVTLAEIYSDNAGAWQQTLEITQPNLIVFAADHGIAAHGVSIAPSEVTQQMVMNFANGGAAINVFTRQCHWQLTVVDAGILVPVAESLGVLNQRLGAGTQAIHLQDAMTTAEVIKGFELAKSLVAEKHQQGCNLIAFGEMGIGNTSSASALMAVILNLSAADAVGRGTGISDNVFKHKIKLVQQAVDRIKVSQSTPNEPITLLAQLGGFEIVQICGAMLAAAELKIPIVVDGFICSAAAMVAKLINTHVSDYLIFSHASGEQGHAAMLDWFDAEPLLDLDLRLGEGTGAALSLPLIMAACGFYNDMASFESAQVDDVVTNQ